MEKCKAAGTITKSQAYASMIYIALDYFKDGIFSSYDLEQTLNALYKLKFDAEAVEERDKEEEAKWHKLNNF